MELITKNSREINDFYKKLEQSLENLKQAISKNKPVLNGEHYLTDQDISEKLKISRRTLQDYRSSGKIPYIQFGGKILYKESNIQKILEDALNGKLYL